MQFRKLVSFSVFLTGFPIWIEPPDHTAIHTFLCKNIPEFERICTTSLVWIRTICERSDGFYEVEICVNDDPNPAPKPTSHRNLTNGMTEVVWVRLYEFIRISRFVKYVGIGHEIALVFKYP